MSVPFNQTKREYQRLLNSLPFNNYGWWLVTREHQDVPRIVTFSQFVYAFAGDGWVSFETKDYNALQRALGKAVPLGGAKVVLNRHLMLNLWKPWNIVQRRVDHRINPFKLTDYGLEIANGDPRVILENILSKMRFADPKWCRPDVVLKYNGISVCPHSVLKRILRKCNNRLYHDEYRIFVARMKDGNSATVANTVRRINSYRGWSISQRQELKDMEKRIFGSQPKVYQNWVDMDLHTFSLMSTGLTFRRLRTTLVLAGTSAAATISKKSIKTVSRVKKPSKEPITPEKPKKLELRSPKPNELLDHAEPPPITANTGAEAEVYVSDIFSQSEFETRVVSRVKGYGFDVFARNRRTSVAFYIEVKSSTEKLGAVQLTDIEFMAAKKYRNRYILACVENFDPTEIEGDVWLVQDPWAGLTGLRIKRTSVIRRATRTEWKSKARRI